MNKLLQDIKDNKNIIIIADNDYLPLLLKYKDTKANIKLMPYNKAISSLTFEINEAMIATLIKNGTEYTKAKQILSNLQLLTKDNIDKAPKVLSDAYKLVKPLFTNIGYDASYILKNKEIYLFNAKDDVQLINLFKSKGLIVNHLSIEDLGIKEQENTKEVINFDNKLEQYFYVFATLRTKLKDPSNADKIKLLVKDPYDQFYLNLFSKLFGIDVYIRMLLPLYNQPTVISIVKQFYKTKAINVSNIKTKDDASKELINIIKKYDLENLSKTNFKFAYLNLLEILVSTQYEDPNIEDKGINATNEFAFTDHETYVLSFEDGIFYKFYKDTDVISDIEKVKLGLNPSYIKTIIDKQKKACYIKYNNIPFISRVKQHLDEHIYDSGLIDELGLKSKPFDFSNEEQIKELTKLSFTTRASDMLAAILADKRYDTKWFKNINSYNNQPDLINVKTPNKYSVSSIQKYNECPFKYLLDTYTTLSDLDDRYFRDLGTLVHSVLEHITDEDFNYDSLFDKAAISFKASIAKWSNGIYDKKYDAYIDITKKWFRYVALQYRTMLASLSNRVKIHNEVKFKFKLDEFDKDFTGKIDALMISQTGDKKFYSIVDYKTGVASFAPLAVCVGQNIQLPMYAYSLPKSDKKALVNGCELGGFGLKHVLGNSPKKYQTDKHEFNISSLLAYTEAEICAINDPEMFKLYEMSLCNGEMVEGKFKPNEDQIVSFTKNSIKSSGIKFEIDINELCEQAKKAVISAIKGIEANDYPIRVTANPEKVLSSPFEIKKDDTNCRYCKYHDICYHGQFDYYDQSQQVLTAWKGEENE